VLDDPAIVDFSRRVMLNRQRYWRLPTPGVPSGELLSHIDDLLARFRTGTWVIPFSGWVSDLNRKLGEGPFYGSDQAAVSTVHNIS